VLLKVCVLREPWRTLSTYNFLFSGLKLMGYITETPVVTGDHGKDVDFLSFGLYFLQCLAIKTIIFSLFGVCFTGVAETRSH